MCQQAYKPGARFVRFPNKISVMKHLLTIFLSLLLFSCAQSSSNNETVAETAGIEKAISAGYKGQLDTATFAGGCFWCTEAVFERVEGVIDVVSGYAGGTEEDANYKKVSYGLTDHTESIQVYFDPEKVSYEELVEIFFATHDPTQLNRQGPDVGSQYRSAVFYHSSTQKKVSENHINYLEKSGKYSKPVVTELNAYEAFYPAEDYHQDFYELNPYQPYVMSVTRPKVEKFEKEFKDKLKDKYRL
jgi:peptide-methionine (S)-S-oxide reductase